MVDYGEDGVVSVAVRELRDQIHGYDFEWLSCGRNVNLVWWWGGPVRECLILLTFGASFDIVFDPFRHVGPPGDSFGGVDGPISSYVCCRRFVVSPA